MPKLSSASMDGLISVDIMIVVTASLVGSLLVTFLWRPHHSPRRQLLEVTGAAALTLLFLIFILLSGIALYGDWVIRPYWAYIAFHLPRTGARMLLLYSPFLAIAVIATRALQKLLYSRIRSRRRPQTCPE